MACLSTRPACDSLDEIRNAYNGRVHRADKASWEVAVTKRDDGGSYNWPTFINLEVGAWAGADTRNRVELRLTSGEARSMAAALIAGADLAEIHGLHPSHPRYNRGELK